MIVSMRAAFHLPLFRRRLQLRRKCSARPTCRRSDERIRAEPGKVVQHRRFVQPATGTFGNSGRNILNGPGEATISFSLFRTIP
jgi:hypothetical protein